MSFSDAPAYLFVEETGRIHGPTLPEFLHKTLTYVDQCPPPALQHHQVSLLQVSLMVKDYKRQVDRAPSPEDGSPPQTCPIST
jgi:hypothetical protein